MPEKRDYYEVLNVGRNAGPDEVRRAYRRLALKYHPDNVKGDKAQAEAKFKELAEAYDVLSDPEKRHLYDRYGHAGLRGAGVHDFSNMGFGDIFEMFQDIFGLGGARRSARRGYDLETAVELTLSEVLTGADKTLEFEREDFCDTCGGSGAKPGTGSRRCSTCHGYGQVETSGGGFFRLVRTCPTCRGRGTVVESPCPACRGSGRMRKKRVLRVHVPVGVQEGQVIRMRGEGEPGEDSALRGDLHCYVRLKAHPFLSRHGGDLACAVPISFPQAALGATVEVPTLTGKEKVTVPPGTQHGDVLRLKGQGLPDARSRRRGDLLVQFQVEVPTKVSGRQEELLRELARMEETDVSPARRGFFEKLKQYFGE